MLLWFQEWPNTKRMNHIGAIEFNYDLNWERKINKGKKDDA